MTNAVEDLIGEVPSPEKVKERLAETLREAQAPPPAEAVSTPS